MERGGYEVAVESEAEAQRLDHVNPYSRSSCEMNCGLQW